MIKDLKDLPSNFCSVLWKLNSLENHLNKLGKSHHLVYGA